MPDEPQNDVLSEIVTLRAAIDREAGLARRILKEFPSALGRDDAGTGVAEGRELGRQLAALGQHVARAESGCDDPLMLRAELATLGSFAATLRTDAEAWRAALAARLGELARREAATRQEREKLAARREVLIRRRDALRSQIEQTAERIVQNTGGEWRRTLPVHSLGEHVSVCSMSVRSPRRGLRPQKSWLVTLNSSRDQVLIRRIYG